MTDCASNELLHRALVFALIPRDADLTRNLLDKSHVATVVCRDVTVLCDEIVRGCGVVILAQETLSDHFIDCLRKVVEQQPPWSDVPIIVLTRRHEGLDPLLARVAPLANVTFLERPV